MIRLTIEQEEVLSKIAVEDRAVLADMIRNTEVERTWDRCGDESFCGENATETLNNIASIIENFDPESIDY
jgi:hypothetical protein